jgi:hypothetical protein
MQLQKKKSQAQRDKKVDSGGDWREKEINKGIAFSYITAA